MWSSNCLCIYHYYENFDKPFTFILWRLQSETRSIRSEGYGTEKDESAQLIVGQWLTGDEM